MRAVIVIPARYESSRFPGKPLVAIKGVPMIIRVARICAEVLPRESIFVATDAKRIAKVVRAHDFNAVMTSKTAMTGTDRLFEASQKIDADIFVNVQGDEPLLNPSDIRKVIEAKRDNPSKIINCYCPLGSNEDPNNVNIPKVVFSEDKRLIYMSRVSLPGYKEEKKKPSIFYKQVCIYAFSKKDLRRFANFGRKSALENAEDIEVLRFLEWGAEILMIETTSGSLAVDTPEDVNRVEAALALS